MTCHNEENHMCAAQILFPISLIAFTIMLMFGFQLTQIIHERDMLNEAKGQQEDSFQLSQKVQAQLTALVLGTQKIADKGDSNAKTIIDKLKAAGVVANPAPQAAPSPAPVPAAQEKPEPGPVKP